jgi:hypothetical protein
MLACIQCKNVFVCTFMHSHYVDTSIECTYIFKHKKLSINWIQRHRSSSPARKRDTLILACTYIFERHWLHAGVRFNEAISFWQACKKLVDSKRKIKTLKTLYLFMYVEYSSKWKVRVGKNVMRCVECAKIVWSCFWEEWCTKSGYCSSLFFRITNRYKNLQSVRSETFQGIVDFKIVAEVT